MMDGYIVYQGPTKNSTHHFAKIGLTCPLRTNPADFYMRVLSVNYPKSENDERQVKHIVNHYQKHIAPDINNQS
jgi:hypothetical protein